jgi:hypothetical protein
MKPKTEENHKKNFIHKKETSKKREKGAGEVPTNTV